MNTAHTAVGHPTHSLLALLFGALQFFAPAPTSAPAPEPRKKSQFEGIATLNEKMERDGKCFFILSCHEETHTVVVTDRHIYDRHEVKSIVRVSYHVKRDGYHCEIDGILS